MPIRIECPNCRLGVRAPDQAIGKKVQCPRCRHVWVNRPPEPSTRRSIFDEIDIDAELTATRLAPLSPPPPVLPVPVQAAPAPAIAPKPPEPPSTPTVYDSSDVVFLDDPPPAPPASPAVGAPSASETSASEAPSEPMPASSRVPQSIWLIAGAVAGLFLLILLAGLASRIVRGPGATDVATRRLPAAADLGLEPREARPVPEVEAKKDAPGQAKPPAAAEPPAAGPREPLDTDELVARSEPSVALIRGKRSSGTAFLVGPRLLATNSHVIEHDQIEDLKVSFPADRGPAPDRRVRLLWEDRARDLALLEVPVDIPPLQLARDYAFRKGEDVTVIGTPGVGAVLLANAVSRGVLSTTVELDGQPYYQLGIAINPGNSGGPVLVDDGRVIGVATLKAAEQEGIAFCIPPDVVARAIETATTQSEEQTASHESRHRLIAFYQELDTFQSVQRIVLAAFKQANDATGGRVEPRLLLATVFSKLKGKLKEIKADELPDFANLEQQLRADPQASPQLLANLSEAWAALQSSWAMMEQPARRDAGGPGLGAFLAEVTRLTRALEAASGELGLTPPEPIDAIPAPPLPGGMLARGGLGGPDNPNLGMAQLELKVNRRDSRTYGSSKLYGRLKNPSKQPIQGLSVVIRARAGERRVRVIPEVIAPGQVATFHLPDGFLGIRDRYQIVVIDRAGQPIPYAPLVE